jgi:hypothetical protein
MICRKRIKPEKRRSEEQRAKVGRGDERQRDQE